MIFEWEDITDEVLEKVVLVQYLPTSTSGFIDSAGSLRAITEEGREYLIGFDKTSWDRQTEILELFLGELPKISFNDAKVTYELEKWQHAKLWVWSNIFIRNDHYDRINSEWQKQHDKEWYISPTDAARELLDPKKEQPEMVLAETQAIRDEEERRRKEREEWRAKNRLVEGEDYEWKEFENVLDKGYCLLLFKQNEDGTISGSKWTIVCQREQFQEGSIKSNAPVEAYNLYYKRYENMGGILNYPEDMKFEGKEIYQYTTLDNPQYHDYGRFHRTYFTFEEAKSAAMTRNEFLGWGEYYKSNLLKRNWSEMSLEEAKKDYFRAVKREMELRLLFPEICGEVLRILSKYSSLYDAKKELGERLGLSEADVRIIYDFFSSVSMFSQCGLEEAEKLLEEAKEYDV